jgi:UDP-galactose transporter B1
MDSGKVQVLTAGGAATPQSSSKKKRKSRRGNRKKKNHPDAETPEKPLATNNADYAPFEALWGHVAAAPAPEPGEEEKAPTLELESSEGERDDDLLHLTKDSLEDLKQDPLLDANDSLARHKSVDTVQIEDLYQREHESSNSDDLFWLSLCFIGIMASFVCYGLLLEYTTSGGQKLHELSFVFVTSGLYTVTAAAGRYVRGETPTTIPPARFAVLGLTSMGSTFCSVRSLRYVFIRFYYSKAILQCWRLVCSHALFSPSFILDMSFIRSKFLPKAASLFLSC